MVTGAARIPLGWLMVKFRIRYSGVSVFSSPNYHPAF